MARPNLPQFDHEYDVYKMRTFVDELNRWIANVELGSSGAGGGSGSGAGDHNDLSGRFDADAHPIFSITGLQSVLDGKASIASVLANTVAIGSLDVRVTALEAEGDFARTQRYFLGEN